MNSRYWAEILIKLLNLNSSVYRFNNNGTETEKSDIKRTFWGGNVCWQVITCHASRMRQGTQGMLAYEHVSSQAALAHEHIFLLIEHHKYYNFHLIYLN